MRGVGKRSGWCATSAGKRISAEQSGEVPETWKQLESVKRVKNVQNLQFHRVGRHMVYHILPTEIWTVLSPLLRTGSVGFARIAACMPRLCPQRLGVLWLSQEVCGLLGCRIG